MDGQARRCWGSHGSRTSTELNPSDPRVVVTTKGSHPQTARGVPLQGTAYGLFAPGVAGGWVQEATGEILVTEGARPPGLVFLPIVSHLRTSRWPHGSLASSLFM